MKILLSLLLIFSTSISVLKSQNFDSKSSHAVEQVLESSVKIKNDVSNSNVNGSPYLFDTWYNKSKLVIDNMACDLNMANFNVQRQRFETNFSKDSVVVINTARINKIIIGQKVFSRFELEDNASNPFFEIIGKLDNTILLKKYKLIVNEAAFNPLTQQRVSANKYQIKDVYFTADLDGSNVKETKLKKSSILKLFDQAKQEKIKDFADENDLDFKDENDVHQIIEYTHTI